LLVGTNSKAIKIGMSVLKGNNSLVGDVNKFLSDFSRNKNISLFGNEALEADQISCNAITDKYAFKGYAQFDKEVYLFKKHFEEKHSIPLDHIYTSKLFYGLFDLLRSGKIPNKAKILAIHSGGLQGNLGFEKKYADFM
jgi:1-aminocyclopropane-1-carboxylate deaminase